MKLQQNVNLQPLNTMAVPATAEYFSLVQSLAELKESLEWRKKNNASLQVVGGGSNIIFSDFVGGLTIQPCILGREVVKQTSDQVWVRFGCGENWHDVVQWCLKQGFYGLENLALIPGSVGAAPVQNIGAYGVDISHFIHKIDCVDRCGGTQFELSNQECEFAYRESVFKSHLKDQRIITHVTLCLALTPSLELTYPALQKALSNQPSISPQLIFDTVCSIRRSKLPDPVVTPNCGSFFKNPIVDWAKYTQLEQQYPEMPSFSVGSDRVERKLAAAWLIDQAGWKGKLLHGVKVHDKQALVITNPNHCGAEAVLQMANDILLSVSSRFGLILELEPQKIGQF